MAAATLSFVIAIIGNIISALAFASPIPTFYVVVKKKSTENYDGLPYIITLLTTSMWTFYGFLKPGGFLIITVNGLGVVFQLIYVSLFLFYASKDKKIAMAKMVALLNVGFLGSVIALTIFAVREEVKLNFVGLVCSALTIGMYASPLSVMGMVIKLKSVECMPFLLSFSLFINAGIWSVYSLIVKDFYMVVPNVIGFVLGLLQLIIYSKYKKKSMPKKSLVVIEEENTNKIAKGGDLEMGLCGEFKAKRYHKIESLPKLLTRTSSMPKMAMKSLSFNSKLSTAAVHNDELQLLG